jgi:acetyl esterase/lipase
MFFIHGGGWTQGDRKKFDKFAETFASQGIGVVATTYRLSPKVQHPAHIEDVAQAFAWTVENIDKYGGRKDQIFVSGHSAGGQLAALLCTNETFLNKHKLSLKNIKGCIPISGVFVIDGSKKENVWGKDPEGWKQASPVNFVSKNNPPFLILFAEKDGKNFHDMGKQLAELLKKEGVEASWREMEGRNHGTIVYNIHEEDDATSPAIVEFIKKHAK